ncbi:MAG: serine hydrolase [Leptospiraceae bacterium]|nr:serine hydrolase [Leptospiraceae bacterium]
MAKHSIRRGFTLAIGLLLGLLLLLIVALLVLRIPGNAAGMAAKGICSAAFVAQRPVDGLLEAEVLPASPVLRVIGVTVDPSARRVSARFAGLFERHAQWLPARGCVLDVEPQGPVTVARATVDIQAPWPQGEAAVPPEQWAGIDAPALQQVVRDAFVGAGNPQAANARGLAVIHKGRALVMQTAPGFTPDTPQHGWSMTKTVLGMLSFKLARETGLAFDTPVVETFEMRPAPPWVADWRGDARKSITVADLMYMRDGLASQEDYDPWGSVPRMLWGSADAPAFAAAVQPEAPPGQRWRYLSQTANLLAAVDRGRLARNAEYWAYPAKALFDPIGARTALLETDQAGNWVGSSYLWASVGDWARLGQLMLQDGRWGEQQVLPPGWLALASTPSLAQGEGRGYGAQTWRYGDPQEGKCKSYGLPADTLAMGGHWGQVVAMVPSRDAVIVRLGWTFRGGQFDSCALIAAVLKTLPP